MWGTGPNHRAYQANDGDLNSYLLILVESKVPLTYHGYPWRVGDYDPIESLQNGREERILRTEMNQCMSKSEGDGANKRTGGGEHKQKKRSLIFE